MAATTDDHRGAKYGRLILQQVDEVLSSEPSRDALLALLKIATPSFSDDDLNIGSNRDSALRKLKQLIHPDQEHSDGATKRFQDTQIFYEHCLPHCGDGDNKRRKTTTSPPFVNLPLQFHVSCKWPFLSIPMGTMEQPLVPSNTILDAVNLAKVMAFRCINFRGAIAHGKRTEIAHMYQQVLQNSSLSIESVFQGHGGYKRLNSVEAIKTEIMNSGPVVSTSFFLTQSFFNTGAFQAQDINTANNPALIMGWQQSPVGEVWLVRFPRGLMDFQIAVGQFSLQEKVLAPTNDFMNYSWQNPSRAYDMYDLPNGWYTLQSLGILRSQSQLEPLLDALGCYCLLTVLNQRIPFVIRDATKWAKSRYAYVTNIEWLKDTQQWKITAWFCDSQWTN